MPKIHAKFVWFLKKHRQYVKNPTKEKKRGEKRKNGPTLIFRAPFVNLFANLPRSRICPYFGNTTTGVTNFLYPYS